MDRRQALQIATGAVSLVAFQADAAEKAATASAAVAGRTPEDVARDEDYWTEIRNAFTIDRNVINFNNGYASPAPIPVQDAMRRYLAYSDMGPIQTMVNVLYPQIERVRENLARVAGCDPEEMAITRNASEANEIVQYGIDLKPGDEVLTTDQDYPRMLMTFRQRERRDGIKLVTVSFPVPVTSADDLYNRIERAVTPKTKLILICHITNRTGVIFPVRRIADMAHARGIPLMVDGAHAFNHFPFKLSDLNCDYYGVSLHKWTCAPIGTGFLYVRKSRIAQTWSLDVVRRQAGERYPEVRGGRHPSRRQSQRDQRGPGLQREYRHPAQGGPAALSARPLGASVAGKSQGEDPPQREPGAVLWHRFHGLQWRGRGQDVRDALHQAQYRHRACRSCRANMMAYASRRTSTRPCAMSTRSRIRWRRNWRPHRSGLVDIAVFLVKTPRNEAGRPCRHP